MTPCGCAVRSLPPAERPRTTEDRFASAVLARLSPHFLIEREVRGRHPSGRRIVIDAILRPRGRRLWKTPGVTFGVEFKDVLRLRGLADLTGWLNQAIDYSTTEFQDFGFVNVFTCPSLLDRVEDEGQRTVLAQMMSGAGVGELRSDFRGGWTFTLGGHDLWNEADGVLEGRRLRLERKAGSR